MSSIKELKGLNQERLNLGITSKPNIQENQTKQTQDSDAAINSTKNKLDLSEAEALVKSLPNSLNSAPDKALNAINLDEDRVNSLLSDD